MTKIFLVEVLSRRRRGLHNLFQNTVQSRTFAAELLFIPPIPPKAVCHVVHAVTGRTQTEQLDIIAA